MPAETLLPDNGKNPTVSWTVRTVLFTLALALYVLLVLIFTGVWFVNGTTENLERFCLWSNIFFLWPVARAAALPAFGETAVFFATFAVSTAHHGCLNDQALREALASETLVLLLLGTWVLVISLALSLCLGARSHIYAIDEESMGRRTYAQCLSITLPLLFGVLISILIAIGLARTPSELDGCLYPHAAGDPNYQATIVPQLEQIWSATDFVTAIAALFIIVVYFLQVRSTAQGSGGTALAVFWLFIVTIIVLNALVRRGLLEKGPMFVVIIIGGVVFFVVRLLVCCAYHPQRRQKLWSRYDWIDSVLGVLIGAVALSIFLAANNMGSHSYWHALGGAALWLILEGLYRDFSAVVVPKVLEPKKAKSESDELRNLTYT